MHLFRFSFSYLLVGPVLSKGRATGGHERIGRTIGTPIPIWTRIILAEASCGPTLVG